MTDSMNWDNFPKPWTIDQCRDRYVMGDRISLRSLSEISQTSYKVIANASVKDEWTNRRSKFRATVDEKTIDIISSQIAGKTAEILGSHYDRELDMFNYISRGAKLADRITDRINAQIEELENIADGDDRDNEKDAIVYSPYRLQALMASLNLAQASLCGAIDGQRKALGLDYSDINYAVSSVRRSGLEVVDKNDFELFKKHLAAQASTQGTEDPNTAAVIVSTLEVIAPSKSADS